MLIWISFFLYQKKKKSCSGIDASSGFCFGIYKFFSRFLHSYFISFCSLLYIFSIHQEINKQFAILLKDSSSSKRSSSTFLLPEGLLDSLLVDISFYHSLSPLLFQDKTFHLSFGKGHPGSLFPFFVRLRLNTFLVSQALAVHMCLFLV